MAVVHQGPGLSLFYRRRLRYGDNITNMVELVISVFRSKTLNFPIGFASLCLRRTLWLKMHENQSSRNIDSWQKNQNLSELY